MCLCGLAENGYCEEHCSFAWMSTMCQIQLKPLRASVWKELRQEQVLNLEQTALWDHVKDRENERGWRENQTGSRLLPLSGVGSSEAPLMEHYVLPLHGLWESRCYDKFRVKMRIERKGRKAKGQNRWTRTQCPVCTFLRVSFLRADVGLPEWRDSVSEGSQRRSWSPLHL